MARTDGEQRRRHQPRDALSLATLVLPCVTLIKPPDLREWEKLYRQTCRIETVGGRSTFFACAGTLRERGNDAGVSPPLFRTVRTQTRDTKCSLSRTW
nr:hypothetical protein CFP56_00750 [Quercus suber]